MHNSIPTLYPQNPQSSVDHHSPDTAPPSDQVSTPLIPSPTNINSFMTSANNLILDTSFGSIPSPLHPLQPSSPQPRRSFRAIKLPTVLQGFLIDTTLPSHPDASASSNEVISPSTAHSLSHVTFYANLSSPHRTFIANMTIQREPTLFSQVVKDPK